MNDAEVIAQLTRENCDLRNHNARMAEAIKRAVNVMVCIGGPLNDNVDGYTMKQLHRFQRISNNLHDY